MVVTFQHPTTPTSTRCDTNPASHVPLLGTVPISAIGGIRHLHDSVDTSAISRAQKFLICNPGRNKPSKIRVPLGCAQQLLVTRSGLLRELVGFVEQEAIGTAICTSIRLYFYNHF